MDTKIIVTLLALLSMMMFHRGQPKKVYGYEYCPPLLAGPDICPDDAPVPNCDENPCLNAVCDANRKALCVPNYCAHCTACFYVHDMLVNCELN